MPSTATSSATPVESPKPVLSINPAVFPPLVPDALRVFSWNINGITPFLQKPNTSFFQPAKQHGAENEKEEIPPPSLRGFLHRHHWPAILFLQEVKIASRDTKTQDAVRTAINSHLPHESSLDDAKGPLYEAHFTLPTDPHNARGPRGSGKVYGVCSILRRDLCETYNIVVQTVDWDHEGRISVVELTSLRSAAKVALYNIYAVNGTEYAWRDSRTGAVRGTRHDRKRYLHRLLMEECTQLEEAGWDMLLAGDMNVAPDARDGYPKLRVFPLDHAISRADFHDKLLQGRDEGEIEEKGLNGVDVWRKMHKAERRYTYFPRNRDWGSSCDRVDHFVAGRKAWEKGCVKACGIMDSEAERGPSDHVPIWADFELKEDAK